MSDPVLTQSPEQKLRSGVIGRIGLVFCAVTLVTLALMALLKPG